MIRVVRKKNLLRKLRDNIGNFKLFAFLGVLTLGSGITFLLAQQQQDLRQSASGTTTAEFGFNTHLNAAGASGYWENLTLEKFKETVDDISSRNQKWIRLNIAPWETASSGGPTEISWNESHLQQYDEAINYANEKGLKVYITTALPDWAKDFSFEDYKITAQLYHTTLASRYKGKIDVWQAWNEADSHHFRDYSAIPFGEENDTPYINEFKELLTATKVVIKNVDSDVLFTTNVGRYPANDAMFENMNVFLGNVHPILDVISLDIYADENFQGLSQKITDVKTRYGKPVIIAETGIPSSDGRFTEEQQAEYVAGTVNEFKLANPMAIIVYQYWDTLPDTDKTESSFGVVTRDGLRKTSYSTIMNSMTPALPVKTGLLRVETNPAVEATITVTSLETEDVVLTKKWGIDWESLPVGNYRLTMTYSHPINGAQPVSPIEATITIFEFQTTTIVANFTTGNITIDPQPSIPSPTANPPSPTIPPPTPTKTLTPTPVVQQNGTVNVTKNPSLKAKVRVINSSTNKIVAESDSTITKSLPTGSYYVSFSRYSSWFRRYKTPPIKSFTINPNRTTKILGDYQRGTTTITYN